VINNKGNNAQFIHSSISCITVVATDSFPSQRAGQQATMVLLEEQQRAYFAAKENPEAAAG